MFPCRECNQWYQGKWEVGECPEIRETFSNWEVREVRRSERRKVSARRIREDKPAVRNRLENACHGRRSKGEYQCKGTV
ncbi:hypothetical protein RCIA129 [Methanocella arvoryzae MRE50]|uniref:Uncharacterized protein n=1 Tax=Methanocella arvoryzae (strain DSM 22066 / NBRC 105507 / MRE50) TaxID=351160 RepID=Q0W467_METAR|nr:hypothetical protein RCIA129 [Methanocella arvoryzae MRE50]